MNRFAIAAFLLASLAPVASGQCPTVDPSFASPPAGNGLNGIPHAAASFQGQLVVGGSMTQAGSTPVQGIASYDGVSWSAFGSAPLVGAEPLVLRTLDLGNGPELYAGLIYLGLTTDARVPVYRWSGTSWSLLAAGPLGSQVHGQVRELVVYDEGAGPRLFAAGENLVTAQIAEPQGILRWDGAAWTRVGAGLPFNHCEAMCVHDDGSGPALFVTGNDVVRKWNGVSWTSTGLTGFGRSLASFDDGAGPRLYAVGSWPFQVPQYHGLARWDGTSWQPVPGVTTNEFGGALSVFDDRSGLGPRLWALGSLVVSNQGGTFIVDALRAFDGAAWSAPLRINGWAGSVASIRDIAGPDALFVGGGLAGIDGNSSLGMALVRACEDVQSFCAGDGSGPVACPCGNSGSAGRGCDNASSTGGALLTASGATQTDTLVLSAIGTRPNALCVFAQGSTSLAQPSVFGDGLRCIGGSIQRLYTKTAVLGATAAPGPGDPSIMVRSATLGAPIAVGATRTYQVYYRDPSSTFCSAHSGGFANLSNALRVHW